MIAKVVSFYDNIKPLLFLSTIMSYISPFTEENIKSAFSCFFRKFTFSDISKAIGKCRKSEFFFLPKPTKKSNFAFSDAVEDDFFCLFCTFSKKKVFF